MTPLVFDVLLKFWMRHIGIIADIEKAFHQIMINPDDRDMLRLLWVDDVIPGNLKLFSIDFID